MGIRVLIIDSQDTYRAGLQAILEADQVVESARGACDLDEADQFTEEMRPDVVTVNLDQCGGDYEPVRRVRQRFPDARVLVIANQDAVGTLPQAFAAGCSGFLVQSATRYEVTSAVKTVAAGRAFVTVGWEEGLFAVSTGYDESDAVDVGPTANLSDREIEVLVKLAQGMTNQQIADELFLSVKTIETYRSRLTRKLGVRSRAEIFQYAKANGYLSPVGV